MGVHKLLERWKDFWKIAEIGDIARRYFVMNSFDDVLMLLGILLAGFFSGITDKRVIITTIIGATIAATISGFWGTYITESAERLSQIKKLERKVAVGLRKSPIGQAHKFATLILAITNSGVDLMISFLILIPFFISTILISQAYIFSILGAFVVLFLLGMFLGKISKENLLKIGLKMTAMGIICALVIFIVGRFIK